ncbi:MAG: acetylornithine/succinylornithine family transaminase [Candidatus Sumerlaeia bacterium]|nr:acetylornithine/succinylornithine family transaminase [Candidatus Sumerlaeia bacterium]
MDYQAIENQYTSGLFAKRALTLVRGEGLRVWDDKGVEYYDYSAAYAVASVGHANPAVAAAIAEQARTLISCTEIFYNDKRALLQQKIASLLPDGLHRFFFCNSGTEALEGAIKFARMNTGKTDFIAMYHGFHGRTLGALSATHKKDYREPFEPLVPGFVHVPYNDIEAATAAVTDKTAAVIVEPVQGEGGVKPASPEYLPALRKLCDERGLLLILDEVQTGFGRTGAWFGFQRYNIVPDILCLGKAIAGGVPMGAIAFGPKLQTMTKGSHGSTFGGNPLACAAALATIAFMESHNLPENARVRGEEFIAKLRAIQSPLIREVRGLGLMLGIELKEKAQKYLQALQDEHRILGLLAGPTVMRFLPPLTITSEDVDRCVEAVRAVLTPKPA